MSDMFAFILPALCVLHWLADILIGGGTFVLVCCGQDCVILSVTSGGIAGLDTGTHQADDGN